MTTDHQDDQPPRKRTKAECGRLGGLQTKARHGTEHFRRAGKLGFAALAKQRGYFGGSRLGALKWLIRKGHIRISPEEMARYEEAEAFCTALVEQVGDQLAAEGLIDDQR